MLLSADIDLAVHVQSRLPAGVRVASSALTGPREHRRAEELRVGRALASRLLDAAGSSTTTVRRGADREPIWPPGFSGSISHNQDVCVVACAPDNVVRGVGIDVETVEDVEVELWPSIATTAELADLQRRPATAQAAAATLFSAKESVYKCVFPIQRRFLEFQDVQLAVDWPEGTFRASSPTGASELVHLIHGCFVPDGPRVVTVAWLSSRHIS